MTDTNQPITVSQADEYLLCSLVGLEWLSYDGRLNPAALDILAQARIAHSTSQPTAPTDYEQYRPALQAMEHGMGLRLDADFPMTKDRQKLIDGCLAFAAAMPSAREPINVHKTQINTEAPSDHSELADEFEAMLKDRNEDRFKVAAFVYRHDILAALRQTSAARSVDVRRLSALQRKAFAPLFGRVRFSLQQSLGKRL